MMIYIERTLSLIALENPKAMEKLQKDFPEVTIKKANEENYFILIPQ